jgi:hypothetical protein
MRAAVVVTFAAPLLGGCAATHYVQATGAKVTEEQHERDLAGCRVTATASQAGNYRISSAIIAEQTIEDCMRSKGWIPAP